MKKKEEEKTFSDVLNRVLELDQEAQEGGHDVVEQRQEGEQHEAGIGIDLTRGHLHQLIQLRTLLDTSVSHSHKPESTSRRVRRNGSHKNFFIVRKKKEKKKEKERNFDIKD